MAESEASVEIRPVGRVESVLRNRGDGPRQPDEGAPAARIVLRPEVREALDGLRPGDRIVVLTWLHRADRGVLSVHPRGVRDRPLQGVFTTRSPDRPNPVGLHTVTVTGVEGTVVTVDGLEAIDGTPVVDIKPELGPIAER